MPFEEGPVHPLERGEIVRRSRQSAIPIVDDDVVADSAWIVACLDERHPARPLIPVAPAPRARAQLLDEGLARTVEPVRWAIAANARRATARFRATYARLVGDLRRALVSATLRLDARRKHGSRRLGAPPAAPLPARLGEGLDLVYATLADRGRLVGHAP